MSETRYLAATGRVTRNSDAAPEAGGLQPLPLN